MKGILSYKRTPVGIIPSEWNVKPLRELAQLQTGPFGTVLKASEYSDGDGVPLISVGEIRDGTLRLSDTTPRVSERIALRLPSYVLRCGDIVFARKGGVERSALVQPQQDGWFLGSDGIRARPLPGNRNSYLAVQFRSQRVQSWLLQHATGTTMPSLNEDILGKVLIALPPTEREQGLIASAISDADALLEALDRLIAKKRDLKQAATQQLLTGQTRLPGFHGVWEVKPLRESITLLSGHHVLAQFCNTDSGVPYLTGPADFPQGRILCSKRTTRPATICEPNDILVTVKGSGSGTIVIADDAYCISRQLMAIRILNGDSRFLYYSLLQNAGQFRAASTGLIPGLSRSDILDQPLPVPPTIEEQTAIASVLSDMDGEITALEQRLAKTRDIKQGMMQELLTGRRRLIPSEVENA